MANFHCHKHFPNNYISDNHPSHGLKLRPTCSAWNTLVKILEQMSMVNFMYYSLGTTAEGFVPSPHPLKDNKHFNILSVNLTKESRNKSESQDLTPSSRVHACGTRRGGCGRASILSVMPNAAPETHVLYPLTRDSPSGSLCWSTARDCLRCPS